MQVKKRYLSLDVFRGAAVCLMILVNNPGSWSHIFARLEDATWHGLTPTDLVYPFFLFAVGNAMAGNPFPLVVPCHRVVGSTGALTGYHWGVPRKRAMLGWESGVLAA